MGISQSNEIGKSIFFLIEANPGPGLGVLLAYMFFGKGSAKQTAGSASIIHFFGGIHEIYFPYVLMNPRLILAVILGGMTGVFTLTLFNAGLVSPASPGSIFAVLLMTPKGSAFGVVLSIVLACAVSFVVASILLKAQKGEASLEEAQSQMQSMKASSKGLVARGEIRKIFVSCDAGMGSSAMGASLLRKKVQAAGLNIEVQNVAINDLPSDAQLVVTHKDLTARAEKQVPNAKHLSLNNFLDGAFYDDLVAELAKNSEKPTAGNAQTAPKSEGFSLNQNQIFLNLTANSKEEAIQFAGEQLVQLGFAEKGYVQAMFEREQQVSTYLGEGIAVPHGTIEAKDKVLKTGIVFCQYREGVRFTEDEDGVAKLVIGIAARNNEHIQVVSAITNALDDPKTMALLTQTNNPADVLAVLKG